MKKIIAAGLMTGMAIAGLSVGAGTANARPYCETGRGYGPAQGLCIGGPYGPVAVRWLARALKERERQVGLREMLRTGDNFTCEDLDRRVFTVGMTVDKPSLPLSPRVSQTMD